jgi:hypothetical protein
VPSAESSCEGGRGVPRMRTETMSCGASGINTAQDRREGAVLWGRTLSVAKMKKEPRPKVEVTMSVQSTANPRNSDANEQPGRQTGRSLGS